MSNPNIYLVHETLDRGEVLHLGLDEVVVFDASLRVGLGFLLMSLLCRKFIFST